LIRWTSNAFRDLIEPLESTADTLYTLFDVIRVWEFIIFTRGAITFSVYSSILSFAIRLDALKIGELLLVPFARCADAIFIQNLSIITDLSDAFSLVLWIL
jgi:hypothetical protein